MRVALLVLGLLAGGGSPNWLKLEHARVLAAKTGKPILLYVGINPQSGEFS